MPFTQGKGIYQLILRFSALMIGLLSVALVLDAKANTDNESPINRDANSSQIITLWDRNYDSEYMQTQVNNLLKLSRERFGPYRLVSSEPLEQGRAFASLQDKDGIDIFIAGIDRHRENNSKVIYFPMDRGLLGFRLCLTSSENAKLNSVSNLQSLLDTGITIGSGVHWPDTEVFKKSGFNVVTSPQYENLFKMLSRDRFDCFPRSVAEVDVELKKMDPKNLVVENNLAFIYPLAEFIFLRKSDNQLHTRLDYGIKKALEDGSFHEIFFKFHANKIELYNIDERFIIRLDNISLSNEAARAIKKHGVSDGTWK